jgi:hypothetical protein
MAKEYFAYLTLFAALFQVYIAAKKLNNIKSMFIAALKNSAN